VATLQVQNNFEVTIQGVTYFGKQGPSTDAAADPFSIPVTGRIKEVASQLATAAAVTLFDASVDVVATFAYLFWWADQITYLQVIGTGSNVVLKVAAQQPLVLPGYNLMLAAASTTAITGAAEPALTTVAKVVAGNYTGTPANFLLTVIL
jgi:hypothetical protein